MVIRWRTTLLALLVAMALDVACLEAEWYRGRYEIDAGATVAPIDHMNYLLYLPGGPRQDWPLIVSLHGKGQEGEDDDLLFLHGLPRIVDGSPEFPFAVLAPHMPISLPWTASSFTSAFVLAPELWGDPDGAPLPDGLRQALSEHGLSLSKDSYTLTRSRLKVIYSPADEGLQIYTVFRGESELTVHRVQWRAADAVIGILDEVLAAFEIDPARVYLTGLSAGGFGAFDLGAVFPHRFAAVAPIAGGGDPDLAPLLRHTPVWAFHGDADRINSPYYTQSMVEALQEIGADVRFTLYPGLGHNVWDLAYADSGLFEWFLEHSLEPGRTVTPDPSSTVGPTVFALQQNFPNPFNAQTTITFDLPSAGWAELSLHNVVGQQVATLVHGFRRAGTYRLRWDGRDDAGRHLTTGVYFYRLKGGGKKMTRRMTLLR